MSPTSKEIVTLLESEDPIQQKRVRDITAPDSAWHEVIEAYPGFRQGIALNQHLSNTILLRLASDPDINVRYCIAGKRRLSAELFRLLSADVSESVRQRVAYNAKVPRDILEILASDPCIIVAEAARKRL